VTIFETDVSPLQLQGPKSGDIMYALFGDAILELRYYWASEFELDGIPLVISRTGWSSELGYEIYLCDGSKGDQLWETLMRVGEPMGLKPGHTSTIRRIEGGMLSYHADMDSQTNPFELGLDRLVALDSDSQFIGKDALRRIRAEGIRRKQVGLIIDAPALIGPNTRYWPVQHAGVSVGRVTSAVYSPRLNANIALAMVDIDFAELGTELTVIMADESATATVVEKPFFDPKKALAAKSAVVIETAVAPSTPADIPTIAGALLNQATDSSDAFSH
jgi:aminomethyltransferase